MQDIDDLLAQQAMEEAVKEMFAGEGEDEFFAEESYVDLTSEFEFDNTPENRRHLVESVIEEVRKSTAIDADLINFDFDYKEQDSMLTIYLLCRGIVNRKARSMIRNRASDLNKQNKNIYLQVYIFDDEDINCNGELSGIIDSLS